MLIESSDAFWSPSVLREVLVSLALVLTECLAAFDLQYLEYSGVFAIWSALVWTVELVSKIHVPREFSAILAGEDSVRLLP